MARKHETQRQHAISSNPQTNYQEQRLMNILGRRVDLLAAVSEELKAKGCPTRWRRSAWFALCKNPTLDVTGFEQRTVTTVTSFHMSIVHIL